MAKAFMAVSYWEHEDEDSLTLLIGFTCMYKIKQITDWSVGVLVPLRSSHSEIVQKYFIYCFKDSKTRLDWGPSSTTCFSWNRNQCKYTKHTVNERGITLSCRHSAGMLLVQPVVAVLPSPWVSFEEDFTTTSYSTAVFDNHSLSTLLFQCTEY